MRRLLRIISLFPMPLHAVFSQPTADSRIEESRTLNFANKEQHPYADPSGGREDHRLEGRPSNKYRLYDFYARQADYYMAGAALPRVIPAFPGMEGSSNRHWGRDSHMDHVEDIWSRMFTGNIVGGVFDFGSHTINKAIAIRLDSESDMHCVFDPESLQYRHVWAGSFIEFPKLRWGLMGLLKPGGKVRHSSPGTMPWSDPRGKKIDFSYRGYRAHEGEIAFHYTIQGIEIWDHPYSLSIADESIFARTLSIGPRSHSLILEIADPGISGRISAKQKANSCIAEIFSSEQTASFILRSDEPSVTFDLGKDGELHVTIPQSQSSTNLNLYTIQQTHHTHEIANAVEKIQVEQLDRFEKGGKSQWPLSIPLQAKSSAIVNKAYVVDDLPIPLANPYLSPMFLTGIAFLSNGDALVSTFFGDIWKVQNLHQGSILWRRIAAGLNQPLGIEVLDEEIYTIGRDQITRLEDLNGDGEIDAYHCYTNQFPTSTGSHNYFTGLKKDGQGNLHFAARDFGAYRVSKGGVAIESLALGVRNPNGLSVTKEGRVYAAPQEGDWTPASMIIRLDKGGFFGFQKHLREETIDLPLVYVPRGIDSSTGGLVFVDSHHFGPLDKKLVALSYGYNSYYAVLEDAHGNGAVVPLPGDFLSGVHRGRVNPIDGQLYIVGLRGWASYAQHDGALHRVRYTGRAFLDPIGFQVYQNGLRIDFDEALDPQAALTLENVFAQQWNYKYSPAYGSPEYSIQYPDTYGHDPVEILSAKLINDGKSIFLEMPTIQPVMQLYVRMHLPFANGQVHKTQLICTPSRLGTVFDAIPDLAATDHTKPTLLKPLIQPREPSGTKRKPEGASLSAGRKIVIKALPGLKYDLSSIQAKAGESLSLTLTNADEMPHNWILADSGAYKEIGKLADAMATDPSAPGRNYIPDSSAVLASIGILNSGETKTITLTAPREPGTYVYLCTFPGHWRAMRGTLIVY